MRPPVCDALELIAQREHLEARVWKGSNLTTGQQNIKVLGTPLGHPDFVSAHLDGKIQEHELLLSRIRSARLAICLGVIGPLRQCQGHVLVEGCPTGDDTQIRERPRRPIMGLFVPTLGHHDDTVRRWVTRYGNTAPCDGRDGVAKRYAHPIPSLLGQLGRLSVDDTRPAPRSGHPALGTFAESRPFSLLVGKVWPTAFVLHLDSPRTLNQEHNALGWQHEAASRVERQFRDEDLFGRLAESERALVRSQSGPGSGVALSPHPYSFPFVSRFVAPTTPPSTLPLPAFVPIWPPTRLVWPPSCSVCSGGMVGEAGVCSGISGSTGLQRGRWPRHDEHARQRVGFARASCRRSQTGGRCGRAPALRRGAIGHRHHFGVSPPLRRHSQTQKMASSWQLRGRGRSGPILSWCVPVPEHGLWFWLARLQAGGLKRPGHLSASSRRLAGGMTRQSSEGGRNKHGGCDGCPFLAAAKRRLSVVLSAQPQGRRRGR